MDAKTQSTITKIVELGNYLGKNKIRLEAD